MKKVFISILLFLPLALCAQNVLTPEQQLEQAQKRLEEAKKAVEAAKIQAEAARLNAEAEKLQAEAEKLKKEAKQSKKGEEQSQKESSDSELKPSIANEPVTLPAKNPKPVVIDVPAENKAEKTSSSNNSSSNSGWEVPVAEKKVENKKVEKLSNGVVLKKDPKYLEGAVTTNADGKIEFKLKTDANGKSAQQIYDIVYQYFNDLTQNKNNIASRVALVNPSEHVIANMMDEWLVFNASFISLDRTEMKYQLVAKIADNSLDLTMTRIIFNYEEGRSTGFKEAAENVISDKVALTKKKNDLAKIFGKFRKGTIDRKDQIFNDIKALLKQ